MKNVLVAASNITNLFYPEALNDTIDFNVNSPDKKYKSVFFGKHVLLGDKVQIGVGSSVGHNTIIESNVKIGRNCIIGSNVLIKNTLISNNVRILDGSIIGKKGFVFFQ